LGGGGTETEGFGGAGFYLRDEDDRSEALLPESGGGEWAILFAPSQDDNGPGGNGGLVNDPESGGGAENGLPGQPKDREQQQGAGEEEEAAVFQEGRGWVGGLRSAVGGGRLAVGGGRWGCGDASRARTVVEKKKLLRKTKKTCCL
jgi:hypothetical protein